MFKKTLNNQKGITLVEVLATLVLFSIISVLAFSILTQTIQHNARSASHVNLHQEANLIITQMRHTHQAENETYQICFDQLQPNKPFSIDSFSVDHESDFSSGDCLEKNPYDDINVHFTLLDEHENDYSIDTTIEAKKEIIEESIVNITLPSVQNDFYTYLTEENVFVYGASMTIGGGNHVTSSSSEGQLIINNSNQEDLFFRHGGTSISVPKIYIDKSGNTIRFDGGSGLGETGITEIISIKGDTEFNYGNQTISSNEVFIDGHVFFNGSSQINANKVYISGDVHFNTWDAYINAEEIYIGGVVHTTTNNNAHRDIVTGEFQSSDLPEHPSVTVPPLRQEKWYEEKGYEINVDTLSDGAKVFANNFEFNKSNFKWDADLNDIIIVSKGDINLEDMGGISLSGVLLAPNGEVTFAGESFEGVVIAKDGFDARRGGIQVIFRNLQHYFSSPEELPFESGQ